MAGKKAALASVLYGPERPWRRSLERLPMCNLNVLAYHRIAEPPADGYPFQAGTVSATPEQFDAQLGFLKQTCSVVNFRTLSDRLREGRGIPDNCVVITFDDGYADNFETALPILQKHGLTATVYLATEFIDSGQPFWFDMLAYHVARMPSGVLELNRGQIRLEVTEEGKPGLRRELGQALRLVSESTRRLMLRELRDQSGADPDPDEAELVRPLTWEQVRGLHAAGIEIGSHTVSHPFLLQLDEQELAREIAGSKARIEEEIAAPVVSFSYPTGSTKLYDERAIAAVEAAGYEFAVSYEHGTAPYRQERRFEIPRLHVELDVGLELFKANLLLSRVFAR